MTATPTAAAHHHSHTHSHPVDDHQHGEHGAVSAESYPHVRGGPQVLDIGGDIGALEAMMPADAAGTELHLQSEHEPPMAVHTGVWHRTRAENPLTTAVFAELPAGSYRVIGREGATGRTVVIRGGELSRIDLR